MRWYTITDEHKASFKSAASSATVGANFAHHSGNDPMISMAFGCAVAGIQLLGKSGYLTVLERAKAKETVQATGVNYAKQAAETAAYEKPARTADQKVEAVADGERITRLAGNRLSTSQQEKLNIILVRRAAAVVRDAEARQMVSRTQGPEKVEELRKRAKSAPRLEAKGPKVS